MVLGTHRRTGQQYAIKIIDKNYLIRMKKKETALAEKNALVQLGAGHPGIVRLYLSYQDNYSLCESIVLANANSTYSAS